MLKKRTSILVLTLLLGLVFLFSLSSSAGSLKDVLKRGELKISTELGMEPLAYEDPETGEATGFCTELARMFAEEIGVDLVVKNYAWEGVIPALTTGKVDMVAAPLTRTVSRSTKMLFTEPILSNPARALVRKDSDIESFSDINQKGVTMVASTGSIWESFSKERFPEAKVKTVATHVDNAIALHTKRADVIVNGTLQLNTSMNQYPGEFRFIPGTLTSNIFAFAVKPGNIQLWHSFNVFMREVKVSGEYAEFHKEILGYEWEPNSIGTAY